MFTRHRLGPTNKLDCPHAMGTNAFSPQRAEPFRHFLLLPSPSVVYHGRKPTNLRVSIGAGAAQLQTSGLRVRNHAGACSPPVQRTATGRGGLAHPLRHPAEAAQPFAVFEGWELGISGAKLLQKDRSIRVQGNEIIYLTLGPWTKPVQILVKPPAHLVFG